MTFKVDNLGMKDENICSVCLSGIKDPICIECLEEVIKTWISKINSKLATKFTKSVTEFKSIFIDKHKAFFVSHAKLKQNIQYAQPVFSEKHFIG